MPDPQRAALIEINIDDCIESFGLKGRPWARRMLAPIIAPSAGRFADQVLGFDADVGARGLQTAAAAFAARVTGGVIGEGVDRIPATGPVLFTSNHPGMADTVALFASIPRADLRIIANDRPFLRALRNVHDTHLIDVSADPTQRMQAMRSALRVLQNGQAALTFPAGKIEPDPAVLPGARASLDTWADSIGLLVKRVPALCVIPVIVSGVLHAGAQRHPVTRLRRSEDARQRLGATLQLIFARYQNNRVCVRFGAPMMAADLTAQHGEAGAIARAISQAAASLLP
jgi:hypothetical protein